MFEEQMKPARPQLGLFPLLGLTSEREKEKNLSNVVLVPFEECCYDLQGVALLCYAMPRFALLELTWMLLRFAWMFLASYLDFIGLCWDVA